MMKLAISILFLSALATPAAAEFDKPALKYVTADWLAETKRDKKLQLTYLRALETTHGFPKGTFRIKWVIESKAGELNTRNKSDYNGHFQYGEYEWKTFCKKGSPFKFKDAAECLPKFLNRYYDLATPYMKGNQPEKSYMTPMDWYHMHNQGYMGAATQYLAATQGGKLPRKVRNNIRNNIPSVYKSAFVGVTDDQTLTRQFYTMWDNEAHRIWTAIKFDDE